MNAEWDDIDPEDFDTIEHVFHQSEGDDETQFLMLGIPRHLLDKFLAAWTDVIENGKEDPDLLADLDEFGDMLQHMVVAGYSLVLAAEMSDD